MTDDDRNMLYGIVSKLEAATKETEGLALDEALRFAFRLKWMPRNHYSFAVTMLAMAPSSTRIAVAKLLHYEEVDSFSLKYVGEGVRCKLSYGEGSVVSKAATDALALTAAYLLSQDD